MRRERARCGAAVHELQLRGLDLQVALFVQRLPDRAGDGGAGPHHLPGLLAGDEVDVAVADPRLLRQLLVQHRQRPQGLRRQPPLIGHHRQLPALGGDHATLHPDVIAQVDVGLPRGEGLLADLRQRQHHLQPLAVVPGGEAVLQRREGQLACVADEHDPATDRHHIAGLLASFEVSPALPHRRQGVAAAQVRGVGLRTGNQQPLPLLLADHSLLGVGGIRGLSTRIGHVRGVYRHQTTKSRR